MQKTKAQTYFFAHISRYVCTHLNGNDLDVDIIL